MLKTGTQIAPDVTKEKIFTKVLVKDYIEAICLNASEHLDIISYRFRRIQYSTAVLGTKCLVKISLYFKHIEKNTNFGCAVHTLDGTLILKLDFFCSFYIMVQKKI